MRSSKHFQVGFLQSDLAVCYGMKGNVCQKCPIFSINCKLRKLCLAQVPHTAGNTRPYFCNFFGETINIYFFPVGRL